VLDTTTDTGARADRRLREENHLAHHRPLRRPAAVGARQVFVGGDSFLIYSQPGRQKLKNIGRNPRVGLHLNSNDRGGDVVRVEGIAEILDGFPPATEIPEYLEKYRKSIARIGFDPEAFARAYSVALRVTPERWQIW
jgi:PPOX class probable F420-dependent enzyme